jgi:hypothetical protein
MPYAYAYNGVSHDAEGHMLGWHINLPTYGDVQTAFTNSVRGENVGTTLSTSENGPISMSRVKLLHGAPVPSTRYTAPDFIDPYNGIVTSQTGYSQHDPTGEGFAPRDCAYPNYVHDTYDRAGRMTMHDYVAYDSSPMDCQQISPATGTTTYAYDSDDHTVLINGKCVGWGPDGHALTFSNFACGQSGFGQSVDTAHYDGDSILFVTTQDTSGTHYSARLEQLGTMVVSSSGVSFTVGDRDMSGNTVGWHNDTGYLGRLFGTRVWTVTVGQPRSGLFDGGAQTTYQNQYSVAISGSGSGNGTFSLDAQGGNLWYDASDGFTFEGKRFQGVRVMDPETGHWTSPDAYAGVVHDPMSQKPFMWNRNNPYAYSDPSGYAPSSEDFGANGKYPEIGHVVARPARPTSEEAAEQLKSFTMGHTDGRFFLPTALALAGLVGDGMGSGAKLFARAGVRISRHAAFRLLTRVGRRFSAKDALATYRTGRLFFDPDTALYVRYDAPTGIVVVVDKPTNGKVITFFTADRPVSNWTPINWRPGQ